VREESKSTQLVLCHTMEEAEASVLPSRGVKLGMRELLLFHSTDELRQMVEAVLDDLGVPAAVSSLDIDPDSVNASMVVQDPSVDDPDDPFRAHSRAMSSDDSPTGGGRCVLDPYHPDVLLRFRAAMASGMDKLDMVATVEGVLLGPAGPWEGSERGYHRVLSSVWEGIAVEYYRSRGGKTPSYKTRIRLMLMDSWRSSDTAPSWGDGPTGAQDDDGAAPSKPAAPFQSVYATPGRGSRPEEGSPEGDPDAASGEVRTETAKALSTAARREKVLRAKERAEGGFDAWYSKQETALAAAVEDMRAAERRVKLGRDATAVMDFLASIRTVRSLEERIRKALAARCREAEGGLAGVVASSTA
jgi:hypothetical protein